MNALFQPTEPYSLGDKTLYHFTKASSFFKIIKEMKLKVSRFNNLNDMNEANLHNLYMNDNLIALNSRQYIEKHCSLVCFTQNYSVGNRPLKGTNHPAMWAHYANNSFGACIVLDEEMLMQKNSEILNKCFWQFADVEYSLRNGTDEASLQLKDNPEDFVKANYKQLFFLKHNDWSNEHERRLLMVDGSNYLDIDGCVKYIVLGDLFVKSKSHILKLKQYITNSSYACSNNLDMRSFGRIFHSDHGYVDYSLNLQLL